MTHAWSARAASPADYETYVRLGAQLGVDDPVPSRERWEADAMAQTLFLDGEGGTFAYALARPLGDEAYVFNIVVDAPYRGRGAGRALMDVLATRLREAGCRRWRLNVKTDNAAAIKLYERCGLSVAYRSTAISLRWDCVAALPREEMPVTARLVDPTEDTVLEDAHGIAPGRLADLRLHRRVILRLVDPKNPDDPRVGVAAFDPTFPGAFPFQVVRPSLAPALLDALRALARPSDTFIRLVIEHDDQLDQAMRAAGAEVMVELFHMEGDIAQS
jgi:GNAT superfamily N-acetyltransferase